MTHVSAGPRSFRRSAAAVAMRQLQHRRLQMLITPKDGVGDLSLVLAFFAPGIAQGHVHWPGGEALYVVEGKGRLRVEGLPFPLEPGIGAFTPPCLEHHVENDLDSDMTLVGAFCPSAIPGSYPDQPPRFQPSGVLDSVEHLYRRVDPHPPKSNSPRIQPAVEDRSLSPHTTLRLIHVPKDAWVDGRAVDYLRAWLVLEGTGQVREPRTAGGEVEQWDVVACISGDSFAVRASRSPLTLLEVEAHLDSALVTVEPCAGD